MTDATHTDKLLAEKTVCILLLRGNNPSGSPIYAYIAVRADKLQEFMRAQTQGIFHPEEFGVIIEAGEGEPNDEVRARMETDYGFNHEQMIDIPPSEAK